MAKILDERLAALDALTLDLGAHKDFENGHCAMELVSWLAGEEHSDEPVCVDPGLTSLFVSLNDYMDDESRQMLKPFLPRLIGTVTETAIVPEWNLELERDTTYWAPVTNRVKLSKVQTEVWQWVYTDLIPYLLGQLGREREFSYVPADDMEGMWEANLAFGNWIIQSGLASEMSGHFWENEAYIHSGASVLVEEIMGNETDFLNVQVGDDLFESANLLFEEGYYSLDDIIADLCGYVQDKIGLAQATRNLAALVPAALEKIVAIYG